MSKKVLDPIISAVLVAILLSAVLAPGVSAQGGQPGQPDPDRRPGGRLGRLRRQPLLGQVTAVTDQQLSLMQACRNQGGPNAIASLLGWKSLLPHKASRFTL